VGLQVLYDALTHIVDLLFGPIVEGCGLGDSFQVLRDLGSIVWNVYSVADEEVA
jgi:hypothetical protein